MKRVGILTSGGDCQALNPTMRGVAQALYNNLGSDVEIIGFLEGYKGLIFDNAKRMTPADFKGILTAGGTILGTSRQPFKMMQVIEDDGIDKVQAMKDTYKRWKLDCLVVLGGNGSQKTANLLKQEGLNVIGLPKTIDNDIWGTDMTFGFQSGVDIATNAIDCIHTTAASHGRVFLVEVMGHKVGWMTLYAGIGGGADVILLPEVPYDIKKIVKKIQGRGKEKRDFAIIAVAEGAISKEDAALSKKEYKKKLAKSKYASPTYELAAQIEELTGQEVRVTIPGHMQRGGTPCAYDRVLSTRLGATAARMIMNKEYGYLVAILNNKVTPVPLEDIANKLKYVPKDCEVVQQAKEIGVCFGD